MEITLIEFIFKAIYNKHLFVAGDDYSLAKMLHKTTLPIPDMKGYDLLTQLPGACEKGTPQGNATLDLTKIAIADLKGFTGKGYTTTAQADYTQFDLTINLAGPRVPAHPSDFDEDKLFTDPHSGQQVTNEENGSPITGPLSLVGIADFSGLVIKGNFTAHQDCSEGGSVDPSGQFIATVDTLTLSPTFQLYIPADLKQPVSVKIPTLKVGTVSADQITITLLRADGSLPDYNLYNLTEDEALNFWFAQNAINFPPPGMPAIHSEIAKKVNEQLSPAGPLNGEIRRTIESESNRFLKDKL